VPKEEMVDVEVDIGVAIHQALQEWADELELSIHQLISVLLTPVQEEKIG
jgi:hypothetical protein